MRSPIRYQSLEAELAPHVGHLRGRVLNAGCGARDITAFLEANGADSVTHCDLDARLPGALRCDLGRVPLADASFDSALCNAVLEHVRCPDEVMSELRRLLKPGGLTEEDLRLNGIHFAQHF